jgi:hypothetical protein
VGCTLLAHWKRSAWSASGCHENDELVNPTGTAETSTTGIILTNPHGISIPVQQRLECIIIRIVTGGRWSNNLVTGELGANTIVPHNRQIVCSRSKSNDVYNFDAAQIRVSAYNRPAILETSQNASGLVVFENGIGELQVAVSDARRMRIGGAAVKLAEGETFTDAINLPAASPLRLNDCDVDVADVLETFSKFSAESRYRKVLISRAELSVSG